MNWTVFAIGMLSFFIVLAAVFAFFYMLKARDWEAHARRKVHAPDSGETLNHWIHELASQGKVPLYWDSMTRPAQPEPAVFLGNDGKPLIPAGTIAFTNGREIHYVQVGKHLLPSPWPPQNQKVRKP